MATEELNRRSFSRERVRNRMIQRAAEIWGFSESEMDDFDPLVLMLIEACAVEFERMSGEIGKTRNRMLEQLAQLLYPGMVDVTPAHGLVQVRSAEPSAMLDPEAQFVYRSVALDRKRELQPADLFFSPACAIKIVDGAVKYVATSRELHEIKEAGQRSLLSSSSVRRAELHHSLWLGIELDEEISSLEGLTFYFNWVNLPDSATWYPYLAYTQWFLDSNPLGILHGLPPAPERAPTPGQAPTSGQVSAPGQEETSHALEHAFDSMWKHERQVTDGLQPHYITITTSSSFQQLGVSRQIYPVVLEKFFAKKELQSMGGPLWWLEIRFPDVVPTEALDNVFCGMNVIPMLNRKLNRFTYKLAQHLNIVALETDAVFLSVKEIINSEGTSVKLLPFANPEGLQPETYTLRYGVNRFDERDSRETLVDLSILIREERSFFSSLGEDFLTQHIRELNQVLARLQDRIKMKSSLHSPYPYLVIRPQRPGAIVTIGFWSCDGEQANRIPIGSKLTAYHNSNVKSNSIFFIHSTHGGRDKLSSEEKIDKYKRLLLSHDRIVTMEDIRAFTLAELGKAARSVEFKKTFMKSSKAGEGFIRCLQITIFPSPGTLDKEAWEQRLKELQGQLEKRSANNIPYHLILSPA